MLFFRSFFICFSSLSTVYSYNVVIKYLRAWADTFACIAIEECRLGHMLLSYMHVHIVTTKQWYESSNCIMFDDKSDAKCQKSVARDGQYHCHWEHIELVCDNTINIK